MCLLSAGSSHETIETLAHYCVLLNSVVLDQETVLQQVKKPETLQELIAWWPRMIVSDDQAF
jgi:hypothetical protein